MTDKEKAKAYDEALEIAKNEINIKGIGETVELCERLFPELREGEDERIRTRLIEYFQGFLKGYEDCYKDGGSVRWEGLDVKSIIAWLEKQKEKKPVEIHIDNPNIQKVDPDIKISTSDSSASGKELLYVSNKSYNIGFRDGVASTKQEWSEGDEQLIGFIFDLLNDLVWRKDWAMSKEECLERLKSLRPSWKPSEEQMSMLLAIINDPNNAGAESCQIALKSLYEHLKKLI